MNRSFLAPLQFQKQFVRNLLQRQQPNKKHIYKKVGNGKRFGCIDYYAKDDFKVPEQMAEPPKLFRVQRFAPLRHRNYWERRIISDLGLLNNVRDVAVVKNTPENNVLLWKIKHLVSVEPITFPYGEPNEEDIKHTKLKECGECVVNKKIAVKNENVEATENFHNDPARLDRHTLARDALLKWVRHY